MKQRGTDNLSSVNVPRDADGNIIEAAKVRRPRGLAGKNFEEKKAQAVLKMYGPPQREIMGGAELATQNDKGMFDDITPEQQDRLRAMLKNFCTIDTDRMLTEVDLRQYGIDAVEEVTNATVQELCAVNPGITRLSLTGCPAVTDVGLWAISRHLGPRIQHLALGGCDEITSVGLRALSLRSPNLISLDFTGCHKLDDVALSTLAGGCWNLENLVVTDCPGITDSGVSKISRSCGKLRRLDLSKCTNVGEFGDKALLDIGTFNVNLEFLNLMGCKRVDDKGLKAIAIGCTQIRQIRLSGCDRISGDCLRALCKHNKRMEDLMLSGSMKLKDKDFRYLMGAPMSHLLTAIDFSATSNLTDIGIQTICQAAPNIIRLNLADCQATDDAAQIMVQNCTNIRYLDLSRSANVTDNAVDVLARGLSALTGLRLDGNRYVSTKALMSHIGTHLEFCEMSPTYVGYRPREKSEDLIVGREKFKRATAAALKIQCMIRRKQAYYVWHVKWRWWAINKTIPRAQARWRGFKQRIRFRRMVLIVRRHRMAVVIQSYFRTYVQFLIRQRKLREHRYFKLKMAMALFIQRCYWGMLGRRRVKKRRDEVANEQLASAVDFARQERAAELIQRHWLACMARGRAFDIHQDREKRRLRRALEERCARLIQRIMNGKLGRIRTAARREEIRMWELRWFSAKEIERVFRGFIGRNRAHERRRYLFELLRNKCATDIQRLFRGGRGRMLATIASNLRILRREQNHAAATIQRVVRGIICRAHLEEARAARARAILLQRMAARVQRVARGHRGREAAELERGLIKFEEEAKPLFDQLKKYESDAAAVARVLRILSYKDQIMEKELNQTRKELDACMVTNAKFSDSAKLTGAPQRFLTKYLRVRLKDHFEHEQEVFKVRRTELKQKESELREIEYNVEHTRRELVPLTTGLVRKLKKERSHRLRSQVRSRERQAARIQALWRGAIVRVQWLVPDRFAWIECYDEEQGEDPYYFNQISGETVWKKPWGFIFFGRAPKETDVW
jgi:F-box/leucine-rich repeat protein 2/20